MRKFRLSTAFFFFVVGVAAAIACYVDDDCSGSLCCDATGTCTTDQSACAQSFVTGDVVVGDGNNTNYVKATLRSFNAEQKNWDLKAANFYCSKWYADKPLAWRKKYSWAAFCAPNGPKDQEACGRCLKVANVATGAREILRIVDKCTNKGGLELDSATFEKLDGTGQGKRQGYLNMKYKLVHCRD